jgi:hypothetical protein
LDWAQRKTVFQTLLLVNLVPAQVVPLFATVSFVAVVDMGFAVDGGGAAAIQFVA